MKRTELIEATERDQDGFWIYLKPGYWLPGDCHSIHEDTKREAYAKLKEVEPCTCSECKRLTK